MLSKLQKMMYDETINYLNELELKYINVGYIKSKTSFIIKCMYEETEIIFDFEENCAKASVRTIEIPNYFIKKRIVSLAKNFYNRKSGIGYSMCGEEDLYIEGKTTIFEIYEFDYYECELVYPYNIRFFVKFVIDSVCSATAEKKRKETLALITEEENEFNNREKRLYDILSSVEEKKNIVWETPHKYTYNQLMEKIKTLKFPQIYIENNVPLNAVPEFDYRAMNKFPRYGLKTFYDLECYIKNKDIFSARNLGNALINNIVNVVESYADGSLVQRTDVYDIFGHMLHFLSNEYAYTMVLAEAEGYTIGEIANFSNRTYTTVSNRIEHFYRRLNVATSYLIDNIFKDGKKIPYESIANKFENEEYNMILIQSLKRNKMVKYDLASKEFMMEEDSNERE